MAAREAQGGPRTLEAAEAERARLQSEISALREALKRRDASCARPALEAAAASLSMTVTEPNLGEARASRLVRQPARAPRSPGVAAASTSALASSMPRSPQPSRRLWSCCTAAPRRPRISRPARG